MSEQRFAWIDHRLWAIEQRLSKVEYQLKQIAGEPAIVEPQLKQPEPEPAQPVQTVRPTPPPVVQPQAWTEAPKSSAPVSPPYTPPPAKPTAMSASPPQDDRDTEYMIGAKLLPKVGAAMVVLSILFFVVWGFSSGWITKEMVFCGELIFCAAFIVLGLFKINEREEFGQILTGIGSCGLYLTFAGGHIYYGLYSGEMLVVQFVALSLANLGYSVWRSSRSFLGIGVIGGLIAALLPLEEQNLALNAALHFAIVVPAALIAARNRWSYVGSSLWLLATAALLPLLDSSSPVWSAKVAALYGTALLSLFVIAREDQNESTEASTAVIAALTALGAMWLMPDERGALHLCVFAVALYGLSKFAGEAARKALTTIAILVPMVLAPMCFHPEQTAAIYAGIAILCSFSGMRRLVWMGVAELGLGICAYLIAVEAGVDRQPEMMLIGGLTLAAATLTRALVRLDGKTEIYVMSCIGLLVPLWARFGHIALVDRPDILTQEMAAVVGLLTLSWVLTGLAWKTKWQTADASQWISFSAAVFAYVHMSTFRPASALSDAAVLIALMANAVAATYKSWLVHDKRNQQELIATAIALVGGLMVRLVWVGAREMPLEVGVRFVAAAGFLLVTVLTSALAARTKWGAAIQMQAVWFMLAAAGYVFAVSEEDPPRIAEIWLNVATMAAGGLATFIGAKALTKENRESLSVLFALVVGAFFLRLFWLLNPQIPAVESVAISATAYAALLTLIARVRSFPELLPMAWVFLPVGAFCYMTSPNMAPGTAFGVVTAILAVFTFLAAASASSVKETAGYWTAMGLLGWALFSRWFVVGVDWLQLDLSWSQAVTMGWTVYAFLLLFLGFAFGIRHLRYTSLFVMACTSLKVLLVDLASARPEVRVLVLLALGLTMLGGGYWYVRRKTRLQG